MSLPSIQELLLRREAKRAFYKENSQGHDVFSKDIYKIIEDRSERFLRDKASIIEEYGEELWNTRYIAGIHISCRLYHQLGMTLEEAKTAYPLTCIEFGEEEFEKWVCEMPEKFGGAYIKATKIRSI